MAKRHLEMRQAIGSRLNNGNTIESLDGLRGLAALIVFVSHLSNAGLLPDILGHGFGQVGVLLFFALSGFLMAYKYLGQTFCFATVAPYVVARIARIYPLYFAVVILSVVASTFLRTDSWFPFVFTEPSLIASSLLMVKSKYVLWSIPVEAQFYLVFLGLWALISKRVSWYWIFLFLVSIPVPTSILYLYFDWLPNYFSKFSHVFIMGIFVAVIYKRLITSMPAVKTANLLGLPMLTLMLFNLPELRLNLGIALGGSTYFRVWLDPATLIIICFVLLFTAMESTGLNFLASRPFRYLGKISYGFYLFHFPILVFYSEHFSFGSFGIIVASIITTLIMAQLSLTYFERPAGVYIRTKLNDLSRTDGLGA